MQLRDDMSAGLLRKQQNYAVGMVVLLLLAGVFGYGLVSRHVNWLQILMVIFTLYAIVMLIAPLIGRERTVPRNDFYRPFVSILIPAKNEEAVIRSTILSLTNLSYFRNGRTNFEILVIDDGSSDRTGQIAKELERKFDFVRVFSRPPGIGSGKAAALNAAVPHTHGEVIAVFDADTQVSPDFLLKSIPLLHPEGVAGVQGRVEIYNPEENFVTKLQNDEFLVFNHLTQVGKEVVHGVTCLGGNGQLVKRDALLEAGGWNEESVTEDFDLTFRLLLNGQQVKYAEYALLWQEAVPTWRLLFRQRIRWGQGLLTSFFDYFLPIFPARITWSQRIDGMLTLSRILLPFWVIDGYLYQLASYARHQSYYNTSTPIILMVVTLIFFFSMAVGLRRIAPGTLWDMTRRVVLYWCYTLIWVIVLPISYFNYFRTYRNFFWDKTYHKGLEEESLEAPASVLS